VKIVFTSGRSPSRSMPTGQRTHGDHRVYLENRRGTFPNYQQVNPQGDDPSRGIRARIARRVRPPAALVCSEKANSVKLGFDKGMLSISAQSPDFGEALDTLAIAYDGPEAKIAFNPAFLSIRSGAL